MSFTTLYALIALLVLVVVFGVTYKKKGLKVAIVTSVVAFFLLVILLVATIKFFLNNM